MKNLTKNNFVALLTLPLLLTGCGGGSSSAPPPAPVSSSAEGMWVGSTPNNRYVTGLIFEDGLAYFLYSVANDPVTIAGVIQGNISTTGATFLSNNTKDFNLEGDGVIPVSITANFSSRNTLNGNIIYGAGLDNTFTTTYDHRYEQTPSISNLIGTYTGVVASSAGTESAVVTVAPDGSLSGMSTYGCSVNGTLTPRHRGNAYVVTLTFGGAPCLFEHETFTGIGYFDPTEKRLYSATPNNSRTDGVLFVGTRP